MSELLHQFLSAYIAWVDEGAPHGDPFARDRGLCSNFEDWMFGQCLSYEIGDREINDLSKLFASEGLDRGVPFGGLELYLDERDAHVLHLNPARIAWVRAKLAQPVEV
jgi:hypothetical protein